MPGLDARSSSKRGQYDLVARVRAVAFPALKVQRLRLAKPQGWVDLIDPHRHVHAAFERSACLVADELAVGTDRSTAPDHDYRFGRFEMAQDRVAPIVAAADVGVPPDR